MFCLLLSLSAYGATWQQDTTSVAGRFRAYRDAHLVEKVFVHTDRSFYVTGEKIWFEAYCFDGLTNQLIDLSKVVYVDLVDATRNRVVETMVALDGGTGSGAVTIPVSLSSGVLVLRAYTRWMRNANPDFFFSKNITVVNPFVSMSKSGKVDTKADLQFFPEGGELVSGLESTVAFKAVNEEGRGINVSGTIVSDAGDTIAHISTVNHGMGKFSMTPLAGTAYRAVMRDKNGESFQATIPLPIPDGYTMHLTEVSDHLRVEITASPGMPHGNELTLFVHTRGRITYQATCRMTDAGCAFDVDRNLLGDGISQLTLFDQTGKPFCERIYFKRPSKRLSIDVGDVEPRGLRNEVTFDLTTEDISGVAQPAQLSVSVFKIDSLETLDPDYFQTYLWLQSDLHGSIETSYADLGQITDETIDLIMLTNGWRRFRWHDLQYPADNLVLAPELRYHLVNVSVTDQSGQAAQSVPVYLTVPGKSFKTQIAYTNEAGRIVFEIPDFYGPHDIVSRAKNPRDSLVHVNVESPFSPVPAGLKFPMVTLSPSDAEVLRNRSIHAQAMNAYWDKEMNMRRLPTIDSTLFYGKADERYLLDNYTRFTVMEEVLREYVPGVFVRNQRGHFELHTLDLDRKKIFYNPLILLDGVPVFDTDKLMAFDPLKIERLEVVDRASYSGALSGYGVISFFTYTGDLMGFSLGPNDLVVNYPGIAYPREFYSPKYDLDESEKRIPDYRTTLFWDPSVVTGTDGKANVHFFTGDVPGRYAVVVQGVSETGLTGTATGTLEVNQSP